MTGRKWWHLFIKFKLFF